MTFLTYFFSGCQEPTIGPTLSPWVYINISFDTQNLIVIHWEQTRYASISLPFYFAQHIVADNVTVSFLPVRNPQQRIFFLNRHLYHFHHNRVDVTSPVRVWTSWCTLLASMLLLTHQSSETSTDTSYCKPSSQPPSLSPTLSPWVRFYLHHRTSAND